MSGQEMMQGPQQGTPRVNFTSSLINNGFGPDIMSSIYNDSKSLGSEPFIMSDEEMFERYPNMDYNSDFYSDEEKASIKQQYTALRQYEGLLWESYNKGEFDPDENQPTSYADTPLGKALAKRHNGRVTAVGQNMTLRSDPTRILQPMDSPTRIYTEQQAAHSKGYYLSNNGTVEKYGFGGGLKANVVWERDQDSGEYYMREVKEGEYPDASRLISVWGPEKINGWNPAGQIARGFLAGSAGFTIKGIGQMIEMWGDMVTPGDNKWSDRVGRNWSLYANKMMLQHENEKQGFLSNMGSFIYTLAEGVGQITAMIAVGKAAGVAAGSLGAATATAGTLHMTSSLMLGSMQMLGREKEMLKQMGLDSTRGDQVMLLGKAIVTAAVERFVGPGRWIAPSGKLTRNVLISSVKDTSPGAVRAANKWGMKYANMTETGKHAMMQKAYYKSMDAWHKMAYSSSKLKTGIGAGIEEWFEEGVEGVGHGGINALFNALSTTYATNIIAVNGQAQYSSEVDPSSGHVVYFRTSDTGVKEMLSKEEWDGEQISLADAKKRLSSDAKYDVSASAMMGGFGEEGLAAFASSMAVAMIGPMGAGKAAKAAREAKKGRYQLAHWVSQQKDREDAMSKIRQEFEQLNQEGLFNGDMTDEKGNALEKRGDPNSRSVKYIEQIMKELEYNVGIIDRYKINDHVTLEKISGGRETNALAGLVDAYVAIDKATELLKDPSLTEEDKAVQEKKLAEGWSAVAYYSNPRKIMIDGKEETSLRGKENATPFQHKQFWHTEVTDYNAKIAYNKWLKDNPGASDTDKIKMMDRYLQAYAVQTAGTSYAKLTTAMMEGTYSMATEQFIRNDGAARAAVDAEVDALIKLRTESDQKPLMDALDSFETTFAKSKGTSKKFNAALSELATIIGGMGYVSNDAMNRLKALSSTHINRYEAAAKKVKDMLESDDVVNQEKEELYDTKEGIQEIIKRHGAAYGISDADTKAYFNQRDVEGIGLLSVAKAKAIDNVIDRFERYLDHQLSMINFGEENAEEHRDRIIGAIGMIQEIKKNYGTLSEFQESTEAFEALSANDAVLLNNLLTLIEQYKVTLEVQRDIMDGISNDPQYFDHAYPYTKENVTSYQKDPSQYETALNHFNDTAAWARAILKKSNIETISDEEQRAVTLPNTVAIQLKMLNNFFSISALSIKMREVIDGLDNKDKVNLLIDELTGAIQSFEESLVNYAKDKIKSEDRAWYDVIRDELEIIYKSTAETKDKNAQIDRYITMLYKPMVDILSKAHVVFSKIPMTDATVQEIRNIMSVNPEYMTRYLESFGVTFEEMYSVNKMGVMYDDATYDGYRFNQYMSFMNMLMAVDMKSYYKMALDAVAPRMGIEKPVASLDQIQASAYIYGYLLNGTFDAGVTRSTGESTPVFVKAYSLLGSGGSGKTTVVAPLAARIYKMTKGKEANIVFVTPHMNREDDIRKNFDDDIIVTTHGRIYNKIDLPPEGSLVFVDEATAMTEEWHVEFSQIAEKNKLKVVMIGDPEQVNPMRSKTQDGNINDKGLRVENVLLTTSPLTKSHRTGIPVIQRIMKFFRDGRSGNMPIVSYAFGEDGYEQVYSDKIKRKIDIGVKFHATEENVFQEYIRSLQHNYENSVFIVLTEEHAKNMRKRIIEELKKRGITKNIYGNDINIIIKTAKFDPTDIDSNTQSGGEWMHIYSDINLSQYDGIDAYNEYKQDMYTVVSRAKASLNIIVAPEDLSKSTAVFATTIMGKENYLVSYAKPFNEQKQARHMEELMLLLDIEYSSPPPPKEPTGRRRDTEVYDQEELAKKKEIVAFKNAMRKETVKVDKVSEKKTLSETEYNHMIRANIARWVLMEERGLPDAEKLRLKIRKDIFAFNAIAKEGHKIGIELEDGSLDVDSFISAIGERMLNSVISDIFRNADLSDVNLLVKVDGKPFNLFGYEIVGFADGKPIVNMYLARVQKDEDIGEHTINTASNVAKYLKEMNVLVNDVIQINISDRMVDTIVSLKNISDEIKELPRASVEQLYEMPRIMDYGSLSTMEGLVAFNTKTAYTARNFPGASHGEVLHYQGVIHGNHSTMYVFQDEFGIDYLLSIDEYNENTFIDERKRRFSYAALKHKDTNGFYVSSAHYPGMDATYVGQMFDYTTNPAIRQKHLLYSVMNEIENLTLELVHHPKQMLPSIDENGRYNGDIEFSNVFAIKLTDVSLEIIKFKLFSYINKGEIKYQELLDALNNDVPYLVEVGHYDYPEVGYPILKDDKIKRQTISKIDFERYLNEKDDTKAAVILNNLYQNTFKGDQFGEINREMNIAKAELMRDAYNGKTTNLELKFSEIRAAGYAYENNPLAKPLITNEILERNGLSGPFRIKKEGKMFVLTAKRFTEDDVRIPLSVATIEEARENDNIESFFAKYKENIIEFKNNNVQNFKDLEKLRDIAEEERTDADNAALNIIIKKLNKQWDLIFFDDLLNMNLSVLLEHDGDGYGNNFKSALTELNQFLWIDERRGKKYIRFKADKLGNRGNREDRADKALRVIDQLMDIATNKATNILASFKLYLSDEVTTSDEEARGFMLMDVKYISQPGFFEAHSISNVTKNTPDKDIEATFYKAEKEEMSDTREYVADKLRILLGDEFIRKHTEMLEGVDLEEDTSLEILGKVSKGLLTLYGRNDNYSVRVAMHEAMHYIMRYMISPVEAAKILNQAKQELKQQGKSYTERDAHEYVADLLMNYQEQPRNWLQKLYDYVIDLLNRIGLYHYSMKGIVRAANRGEFSNKARHARVTYNEDGTPIVDNFTGDELYMEREDAIGIEDVIERRLGNDAGLYTRFVNAVVGRKINQKLPSNKSFTVSIYKNMPQVAISTYRNLMEDYKILKDMKFFLKGKDGIAEEKEYSIWDINYKDIDDIRGKNEEGVVKITGRMQYKQPSTNELIIKNIFFNNDFMKAFVLSMLISEDSKGVINDSVLTNEIENIIRVNLKKEIALSGKKRRAGEIDDTFNNPGEASAIHAEREQKSPLDTVPSEIAFMMKTLPVYFKKPGQKYSSRFRLTDENIPRDGAINPSYLVNTLADIAAMVNIRNPLLRDRDFLREVLKQVEEQEKLTRDPAKKDQLFSFLIHFGERAYVDNTSYYENIRVRIREEEEKDNKKSYFDYIFAGYAAISNVLSDLDSMSLENILNTAHQLSDEYIDSYIENNILIGSIKKIDNDGDSIYIARNTEYDYAGIVAYAKETITKNFATKVNLINFNLNTNISTELKSETIERLKRLRDKADYVDVRITKPLIAWLKSYYTRTNVNIDITNNRVTTNEYDGVDKGKGDFRDRLRNKFYKGGQGLNTPLTENMEQLLDMFDIDENGVIKHRDEVVFDPTWKSFEKGSQRQLEFVNAILTKLGMNDTTINARMLFTLDTGVFINRRRGGSTHAGYTYTWGNLVTDMAMMLYGARETLHINEHINDMLLENPSYNPDRRSIPLTKTGKIVEKYYEDWSYNKDTYTFNTEEIVTYPAYSPTDMIHMLEGIGKMIAADNHAGIDAVFRNNENNTEQTRVTGDRMTDAYRSGEGQLISMIRNNMPEGINVLDVYPNLMTRGYVTWKLHDNGGMKAADGGRTYKSLSQKDYVDMMMIMFFDDLIKKDGKTFRYMVDPHADRGKSNLFDFRFQLSIYSKFFIVDKDGKDVNNIILSDDVINAYDDWVTFYVNHNKRSIDRWKALAEKYNITDANGVLKTDPKEIAKALNERDNGRQEARDLYDTLDYHVINGKIMPGNAITFRVTDKNDPRHKKSNHVGITHDFIKRYQKLKRYEDKEKLLREHFHEDMREFVLTLHGLYGDNGLKQMNDGEFQDINYGWNRIHSGTRETRDLHESWLEGEKINGKRENESEEDYQRRLENLAAGVSNHYLKTDQQGNILEINQGMQAFFLAYHLMAYTTGSMTRGADLQYNSISNYFKRSVTETTPRIRPVIGEYKTFEKQGNVLVMQDLGGSHHLFKDLVNPKMRTDGISFSTGVFFLKLAYSGLQTYAGGVMIKDVAMDMDYANGVAKPHKKALVRINEYMFKTHESARKLYEISLGEKLWNKYEEKLNDDFYAAEMEIFRELLSNPNEYRNDFVDYIVFESAVKSGSRSAIEYDKPFDRASSIQKINWDNYGVVYNTEQDITDPNGPAARQIRAMVQAGSQANQKVGKKLEQKFLKPIIEELNTLKALVDSDDMNSLANHMEKIMRGIHFRLIREGDRSGLYHKVKAYIDANRTQSDSTQKLHTNQALRQDINNRINSILNKALKPRIAGNFYNQAALPFMYISERDGHVYQDVNDETRREIQPMRWYNVKKGEFATDAKQLQEGEWRMIPAEVIADFHYAANFGISEGQTMAEVMSLAGKRIDRKITESREEYKQRLKSLVNGIETEALWKAFAEKKLIRQHIIEREVKGGKTESTDYMAGGKIKAVRDALISYYEDLDLALDIISVRIPTSGTNLTQAGRIVDFGWGLKNTVLMSQQKSILDGSDYDIDQLLIFYREFSDYGNIKNSLKTQIFDAYSQYYKQQDNIKFLLQTLDMKAYQDKIDELTKLQPHRVNSPASSIYYDKSFRDGKAVGFFANMNVFSAMIFRIPAAERAMLFPEYKLLHTDDRNAAEAINLTSQLVQLAVDNGKMNGLGIFNIGKKTASLVYGYMLSQENLSPDSANEIIGYLMDERISKILRDADRADSVGGDFYVNLMTLLGARYNEMKDETIEIQEGTKIKAPNEDNKLKVVKAIRSEIDEQHKTDLQFIEMMYNYAVRGEAATRLGMMANITKGIENDNVGILNQLNILARTMGMDRNTAMAHLRQMNSPPAEMSKEAINERVEQEIDWLMENYLNVNADVERAIRSMVRYRDMLYYFPVEHMTYVMMDYKLRSDALTNPVDDFMLSGHIENMMKFMDGRKLRNYVPNINILTQIAIEMNDFVISAFLHDSRKTGYSTVTANGQTYDVSNHAERAAFMDAVVMHIKNNKDSETFYQYLLVDISKKTNEEYLRFPSTYRVNNTEWQGYRKSFDALSGKEKHMLIIYNMLAYGFSEKKGSMSAVIMQDALVKFERFVDKKYMYPNGRSTEMRDILAGKFLDQVIYRVPRLVSKSGENVKRIDFKFQGGHTFGHGIMVNNNNEWEFSTPIFGENYNSYVVDESNITVPYPRLERLSFAHHKELRNKGKVEISNFFVVKQGETNYEGQLKTSLYKFVPVSGKNAVTHDGIIVKVTKVGKKGALLEVVDETAKPDTSAAINPDQNSITEAIKKGDITYTNEQGEFCGKAGARGHSFTRGSKWEVVKDLKGYPSHTKGGVDIKIGKGGVSIIRGGATIMAAEGLVLKAFNGNEEPEKTHVLNDMPQSDDPPYLFVDDKNDARYKAYSDSLSLYKEGLENIKIADNSSGHKHTFWDHPKLGLYERGNNISPFLDWDGNIEQARAAQVETSNSERYEKTRKILNDKNKPIKIAVGAGDSEGWYGLPIYAKPKYPVFLKGTTEYDNAQKQEELQKAGLYEGKIDGIWGKKSKAAFEKFTQQQEHIETPMTPSKEVVFPATEPKVEKSIGKHWGRSWRSSSGIDAPTGGGYYYLKTNEDNSTELLTVDEYNKLKRKSK